MEGIAGGARNGQMAQMRRIETSAEEGNPHRVLPSHSLVARRALAHGFIVQRAPDAIRALGLEMRQLESG
jgi:hypothetical protein